MRKKILTEEEQKKKNLRTYQMVMTLMQCMIKQTLQNDHKTKYSDQQRRHCSGRCTATQHADNNDRWTQSEVNRYRLQVCKIIK